MRPDRRRILRALAAGFVGSTGTIGCGEENRPMSDAERDGLYAARMQHARDQDEREVARLYSTKPIRVRQAGREYLIPANYFTPKGKDDPDTFDASEYFGFYLFLPDFGGYTKDNWQDHFDRRRIDIVQVKAVDKTAVVQIAGGGTRLVQPASYGDPEAGFANLKPSLVREPALDAHNLDAYVWVNRRGDAFWTGTRSNGEFFFFNSTDIPGQPRPNSVNPLCDVRYYSRQEGLFVAYRYSMDHFAMWREVDDAIWLKLRSWRVK